MDDNLEHINTYLVSDPKGKLVLPYLKVMTDKLEKEHNTNHAEIDYLEKNLEHIKNIVAQQQSISGVVGFYELIDIDELMENVLDIANIRASDIVLSIKITLKSKSIFSDKSKLLQILTNLLRNAKEAVFDNSVNKIKKINVKVLETRKDIRIIIEDNGSGVAAENLDKIFSFGFTTKQKGHGFGLHSSAISAASLGGSLHVESEGIGLGAKVTLKLPISIGSRNKGDL